MHGRFTCGGINSAEAVPNERINWGFKRGVNHQPPDAGRQLDNLVKKYDAFYLGNTKEKTIYLTFDNGYENGYTPKVLDVLKNITSRALFCHGSFCERAPDLIKRMSKEGHIIGNHSFHHPDLTTKTGDQIQDELDSVTEAVYNITGKRDNLYLRPPRGVFSEYVLKETKRLGYQTVFWSVAFVDWKVNEQKGNNTPMIT